MRSTTAGRSAAALAARMTLATLVLSAGCATTTTRIAPVAPERVREEEARQRQIVLTEIANEQRRLDSLAYPLLRAAGDLCEDKAGPLWGFRARTADSYSDEWRDAAIAIGLTDRLTVTHVVTGSAAERAGLMEGDIIDAIDGVSLPEGKTAASRLAETLADATGALVVGYTRNGTPGTARIEPDGGCALGTVVVSEGGINAFADGHNVIVPWAMMRIAEDAELNVVISHEIAHNAMRHVEARQRNAFLGALLGAIGDVAMATQGVNTGGTYTSEFAALGARTYSQDFEREADYVGMYVLARAGVPLESAPMLWRHFAQIDPSAIAYASTHPTTAERFVLLESTAAEIERKLAEGAALLPEKKEERRR